MLGKTVTFDLENQAVSTFRKDEIIADQTGVYDLFRDMWDESDLESSIFTFQEVKSKVTQVL